MHSESFQIKAKAFLRDLVQIMLPHWEKVFYVLAGIILISQISVIGSFAVKSQDQKSIVYALDNDAGRAISTAEKTRWWNSNGFAPYGPLYFRIAHTVASFVPYAGPDEYNEVVKSERIHQLALQLASLCALYGWAFLLSSILVPVLWQRLLLSTLMVSALTNSFWASMVMRAHPDMTLALTVGLATYATARWIYEDKSELEKWAALAWGVAVGTKAVVILFTPALVFLFFPWNKLKLIQGLKFLGWMLLGYTLIGFPQSLSYGKVLNFLLGESAVSMPSDRETVLMWLNLMKSQIFLPFVLGVFVIITTSNKGLLLEKKKAFRLFIFCLIPILILLTRKQAYNPDHFTMPFFSCFLVGGLFILRRMTLQNRRPYFLAAFLLVPTVPGTFQNFFNKTQVCKPEAREFAAHLEDLQKNQKLIAHDPYVPVSSVYQDFSKLIWGMRWSDLTPLKADALGLNRNFYHRYFEAPPPHLWPKEAEEWPTRKEFYQAFADHSEVMGPDGISWKKTYENSCGMELWLRKTP
jgi:hypothetical protein